MCKLDFHFYKSSFFILFLGVFLYIFGNFYIPLYNGLTVTLIEHLQSLFLLFMCGYTFYYAKRVQHHATLYKFWIWTIFWWFMLFGRGISWGRDFYPNVPRLWHIFFAFLFLGIADIAEHHRMGHEFLVLTRERKDLIEELMEIPCLLCIALTTFYMQTNEQKRLSKSC